jgi:Na+-translocating ferredoxin:NAD+ oxidoreductase RnfD subunit
VNKRHMRAWRRVRHFARTPKGVLTFVLLGLLGVAARVEGVRLVGPGLLASIAAAVAVDAPMLRWRRGRWVFPSGAVLTGLLVGTVLSSFEPLYVFATASAVGIAGKYLVRTRSANVFNPAALGLVAVFHLFDTAQNWWGALPAIVPGAAWPLLLGTGFYVAHRVNKVPLVLTFLAAYFAIFAAATFVMDVHDVAEVFVAPDLLALAFCACFILTDPPTSPTRLGAQVVCGVLAAVASAAIFIGVGAAHFLLGGVLAGNVFEAARRWRVGMRAGEASV